ncbi:MAG: glycosyltransferase family 9 protein, partial [Gammaproteobacteria bacterium]
VWAYTKAKHQAGNRLLALWREARVYRALRHRRFDLVIHATPAAHARTGRLARWFRAPWRVGVCAGTEPCDFNLPTAENALPTGHHVEKVHALLAPLGIDSPAGGLTLVPRTADRPAGLDAALAAVPERRPVGLHISVRNRRDAWTLESFEALARALYAEGCQPVLFWSPGAADDRRHPGDDEAATELVQRLGACIVKAPTASLAEIAAGLAAMDLVVCAVGGTSHIAAGVGTATVALFGTTDPVTWGPWGVPARNLVGADGRAASIPVGDVHAACRELLDAVP